MRALRPYPPRTQRPWLLIGSPAIVQIYTKSDSGAHFSAGRAGRAGQRTNLYQNWPPEGVSQQVAQGSPATVQIYTKSGLWGAFPNRPPRGTPPAYKSIPKLASGGRFPAGGPGKPRHRTNLYENWPLGPISQQVAQGGPASVQIYTRTGLRRAFPSRWPREAPPPYKSIRKVASGGHFPANDPGGCPPAHFIYNNCKYIQLFKNRWTILKECRINTICKFWFEN